MPHTTDERSVSELLRQVAEDGAHLAQREVSLARIEFSEAARDLGQGTGLAVGSALLGLLTVQMLMFALVLLIGAELFNGRWWMAALGLTIVLGVASAMLFARAKALLSPKNIMPQQTLATLGRDTDA
ncbi:MAG: phage holin family protein [Gemmatimonadaceae bacterium]